MTRGRRGLGGSRPGLARIRESSEPCQPLQGAGARGRVPKAAFRPRSAIRDPRGRSGASFPQVWVCSQILWRPQRRWRPPPPRPGLQRLSIQGRPPPAACCGRRRGEAGLAGGRSGPARRRGSGAPCDPRFPPGARCWPPSLSPRARADLRPRSSPQPLEERSPRFTDGGLRLGKFTWLGRGPSGKKRQNREFEPNIQAFPHPTCHC